MPACSVVTMRGQSQSGLHGIKLEQVREQLQARSYTAVAMQVGRLQRQLPHQPQLGRRLKAIARHLNVQC
jgi:hypothetical protein